MLRFCTQGCLYKSYELTKKLEVTLGPDTAELSMRFGLHSGPVTVRFVLSGIQVLCCVFANSTHIFPTRSLSIQAGVLRGGKSNYYYVFSNFQDYTIANN